MKIYILTALSLILVSLSAFAKMKMFLSSEIID